jgi:hypothetical protein
MKTLRVVGLFSFWVLVFIGAVLPRTGSNGDDVSYKGDVEPILKRYCLPCHAEENFNPSGLALDSYALLMNGGKHGETVVARDPEKSILIQKLSENPKFDERMPLHSKRRNNPTPPVYLSDDEVKILSEWISQGARNN